MDDCFKGVNCIWQLTFDPNWPAYGLENLPAKMTC